MAPKRKPLAAANKESDGDSSFLDDGSGSDVGSKRPATKKTKKTQAKRKVKDEEGGGETPKKESKPKKPAAPKAPKLTEPTKCPDGWVLHPPSLIYRVNDRKGAAKIAAFDFDGTLSFFKDPTRAFALGADDWQLYNSDVGKKLKALHNEGFSIVVFSNQGGIKTALAGKSSENARSRFSQVFEEIGVPIAAAFMATMKDEFRKPEKGMFDFFLANCNGGTSIDKKASFFCGDAAGRPGDILETASDKEFAEAIGLPFRIPEEVFGESGGGAIPTPKAKGPNAELAVLLLRLSDRFSDHAFKASAFKKAARALEEHPVRITNGKQAQKVPSVGKGSAAYIDEFLETGKVEALDESVIKETKAKEEAAEKKDAARKASSDAFAFL